MAGSYVFAERRAGLLAPVIAGGDRGVLTLDPC